MWLIDPKTGEKSVTLTILVGVCIIASVKLLLSGVPIGKFTVEKFSGYDFAIVVGAVGALYWGRKNTDASITNNNLENK